MIYLVSTSGAITITVISLLVLVLVLVGILIFAKDKLLPSGNVKITINDDKVVEVPSGGSLLSTLGSEKIFFAISLWWWWNLYSM